MNPEFSIIREPGPNNGIWETAQVICQLIQAEAHMVNIPPPVIQDYMKHGLAAWLSDAKGTTIGGFIKAMPWHPNLAQAEGLEAMEERAIYNVGQRIAPTGFEVGSLLVPPAFRNQQCATALVNTLATHIHALHPDVPLFAVIDQENIPSTRLFQKLGWVVLNGVQQPRFHDKLEIDVLQGWKANILLDPNCLHLLQ